jgi:hypothetical protein
MALKFQGKVGWVLVMVMVMVGVEEKSFGTYWDRGSYDEGFVKDF